MLDGFPSDITIIITIIDIYVIGEREEESNRGNQRTRHVLDPENQDSLYWFILVEL